MTRQVIQVFEYQTLKVGDHPAFTSRLFKALERYAYKNKEKYFTVGNKRIKFNNYVGVVQVKNLTIEILPKADNDNRDHAAKRKWHDALIQMLQECKLIKLNSISNAQLKLKSASILDLFYDLFLTETETIYTHGFRKEYRVVEQNINKIKGKIIFPKHIQRNLIDKTRFYVQHRIFDKDNVYNQILYKALLILKSISTVNKHIIRINKLLLNFEGIAENEITAKWFEKLKYDRNSERYRTAINLAKLIILRYSPDLKGGRENVLAILFDMNLLFESYVYQKLKVVQRNPLIPITRVKAQNSLPFWEANSLRADIVVDAEDKRIVIDTKWKILKSNSPSGTDLKQMFAYNLHYDTNLSILLYPKTSIKTKPKKPFRKEVFNSSFCQVGFIEIFDVDGKLEKNLGEKIYNQFLKVEVDP